MLNYNLHLSHSTI